MRTIKKAQNGLTNKSTTDKLAESKQNRKKLDSITAIKRADITRKKDSILQRNANSRGMTREQVRAQQQKDKKKPDATSCNLNDPNFDPTKCGINKAATKQSKKDFKKMKTGGMLKRADGSYSKRGLWDNIRANKGSGKKPTAAMLKQERKIKSKK